MSIWATSFSLSGGFIDDDGLAPYVYENSVTLPHEGMERDGDVDVAVLSKFVRYYREHPHSEVAAPEGIEPWLRLSVNDATVILDAAQVRALHATLAEWLNSACPNEKPASPPLDASN